MSLNAILTPIPSSYEEEGIAKPQPLRVSSHEINERHFEIMVSKRWQSREELVKALTAHIYFVCAFLPTTTRQADRLKMLRFVIEQASEVIGESDEELKTAIKKLYEVAPRWEWDAAMV